MVTPTKYTHENAHLILEQKTDDDSHIHGSISSMEFYQVFTDTIQRDYSIVSYFEKLYHQEDPYIWIDSGAGRGRAIRDLMLKETDPIFSQSDRSLPIGFLSNVKKCIGISVHIFAEVARLLTDFPDKVEWHHGMAQQVLPQISSNSVDLITDIFGAYHFSTNKMKLLSEYHRVLKPNGRCYFMFGGITSSVNGGEIGKGMFESFLAKIVPGKFILSEDKRSMVMIKTSTPFPNHTVTLKRHIFYYCDAAINYHEQKFAIKLTDEEKAKGGAAIPYALEYDVTEGE